MVDLIRNGHLINWLGIPDNFPGIMTVIKNIITVPLHLTFRGPQYPELWLGKAPMLDLLCLCTLVIGAYFYTINRTATRSKLLLSVLILGILLVGLGGPVSLSVLVPIIYVLISTGVGYLIRAWYQVFPVNPIARSLGISLVIVVVGLSTTYNLRAYFVAWPHAKATQDSFHSQR
ncbi:MAG: hypothetical protein NVS1B10_06590 [Candidatus Saccharimonadales bacterium]